MIRRAGPAERVVEAACVPHPCHISPATLRAMARRPWGNARKLPSGRWQARYQVQGRWRNAPETFRTKSLADSWLAATRTDLERGNWIDPGAGKVHLTAYAQGWLAARPELRPRTKENYRSLLKLHILPTLGQVELGDLSPATVRTWRAGLIEAGHPGSSTIAKAYRLLHAMSRDRTRGRRDRPQPVRHQGCLRRTPGRAPCRHDRADRRDRRRHRAAIPGHGAARDVLRAARR